jgi:hypothetical protein
LRTKEFLYAILSQLFEVLLIDDSECYKAKLSGPRARILTDKVEMLPKTVTIHCMDTKVEIEHTLAYSGFTKQCTRYQLYDYSIVVLLED